MNKKHRHERREHTHPLDIGSDDHSTESENPTLVHEAQDVDDPGDEDRDFGGKDPHPPPRRNGPLRPHNSDNN